MTPQQIIEQNLAEFLVRGKRYPLSLPPNLAEWHCYTSDGGHSILCLLEGQIEPGDLQQQLCPVPVKTVLRGWRTEGAYVVATTGFRYDAQRGLITDPDDDEF